MFPSFPKNLIIPHFYLSCFLHVSGEDKTNKYFLIF